MVSIQEMYVAVLLFMPDGLPSRGLGKGKCLTYPDKNRGYYYRPLQPDLADWTNTLGEGLEFI